MGGSREKGEGGRGQGRLGRALEAVLMMLASSRSVTGDLEASEQSGATLTTWWLRHSMGEMVGAVVVPPGKQPFLLGARVGSARW